MRYYDRYLTIDFLFEFDYAVLRKNFFLLIHPFEGFSFGVLILDDVDFLEVWIGLKIAEIFPNKMGMFAKTHYLNYSNS